MKITNPRGAGRKTTITPDKKIIIMDMISLGYKKAVIADKFGITKQHLSVLLRKWGVNK